VRHWFELGHLFRGSGLKRTPRSSTSMGKEDMSAGGNGVRNNGDSKFSKAVDGEVFSSDGNPLASERGKSKAKKN